jgi:benzylsuccinate CoA-transferase BbsF subunit
VSATALAGVHVIEFGSYAAGPHIGKMLANFGATVVHVESRAHPDGFRMQYPPYKGGTPQVDSGGCFAYFNDSKFGITLDLKNARGVELAKRLALSCDVVIENMRPGVIARLGLGYDALSRDKPSLVMLSTCNMGQTGPRAETPGFGSQLTALAGMCNLTGEPGGPPMLLYGPYIDFIASTLGASAVLAALERLRKTGKGAYLDISQYECGLLFLAGPLLDYHVNGRVAARAGNAEPQALLHGAYRCANGTWLALSCWSKKELQKLERIHSPGTLEAWLAAREAAAAAETLQAAGVHAHAVNTVADLFSDQQLAARGQWRRRAHPMIGHHAYCFPAFDLSETPGEITAPAPTLGEHNERVCRELLGMKPAEYAAYESAGAFA